jgi:hypothetical protein
VTSPTSLGVSDKSMHSISLLFSLLDIEIAGSVHCFRACAWSLPRSWQSALTTLVNFFLLNLTVHERGSHVWRQVLVVVFAVIVKYLDSRAAECLQYVVGCRGMSWDVVGCRGSVATFAASHGSLILLRGSGSQHRTSVVVL